MATTPDRCCDLVMKGGITSGVVYPRVVEEVAKRFHLVGIAGTSAGAIAASLAAAAEYRRRNNGSFDGFEVLAGLGTELATPGKLLGLFTPDRETRKLFNLFAEIAEEGLRFGKKVRLAWLLLARREKALRPLRNNFCGFCTGMANGNAKQGVEPLTAWLSRRIDEVAGMPKGQPLTFRDLHGAPAPKVLQALVGEDIARSIDYRAVTTCLGSKSSKPAVGSRGAWWPSGSPVMRPTQLGRPPVDPLPSRHGRPDGGAARPPPEHSGHPNGGRAAH